MVASTTAKKNARPRNFNRAKANAAGILIACLNDVENIQKNGKIVRKQISSTMTCTRILPRKPRCRAFRDLGAVTILAIVHMSFDEAELQPGQEDRGNEDDGGNGTGVTDLEVFEPLFVEVVDDIGSGFERPTLGQHVDRAKDII